MANDSTKSRVSTPSILQMQPTECGVVSLAIIMASLGKWVPIAEIRATTGLDGNGLSVAGVARAGQAYGLEPHVYQCEVDSIDAHQMPVIGWWERRHFVVIEGRMPGGWRINDPEAGHRLVPDAEFESKFSGMIIEFTATDAFERGGRPPRTIPSLRRMIGGGGGGFLACAVASTAVIPLHLAMAGFLTYFVDHVLENPSPEILRPFLFGVGIVVILRAALSFILAQTQLRLRTAAGLRIEVDFLKKTLGLSDRELTLRLPGDIQQRIPLGRSIAGSVVGSLSTMPSRILSVLVFGGAVFLISPIVGFGVILASIAGLGIVKGVNRLLFELNTKTQMALSSQRSTMFAGLSSQAWLYESGSVGGFLERWTSELASARSLSQRSSRTKLFASSSRGLLSQLVSQVATLVFGGLGVIAGDVTIGELAALQLLVGHAEGSLGGLIGFAQSLPILKSNIARLDDIMDCPDSSTERMLGAGGASGPSGLKLENIAVGRQSRLNGLAAPGVVTVIEGCPDRVVHGLAKQLSGRLRRSGTVTWQGTEESDPSLPRVRVVRGHFPLFPGTYAENLGGFDPNPSHDLIWPALVSVELDDRFEALPLGLQAAVHPEDGFSSGEDSTRLELATVLIDAPEVVIVASGMASLPQNDAVDLLSTMAASGAVVLVIEPGAAVPEDAVRIAIENPTEDDR